MNKTQHTHTYPFITTLILLTVCALSQAQSLPQVAFSKPAGKYEAAVRVALSAAAQAQIYYTTDGSTPSSSASRYDFPLIINQTTTIRAVAYKNGERSPVATATFLIGEDTDYLIAALSLDPSVLNDPQKGWLKDNPKASAEYPYEDANFWSREEKRGHLELIESNGRLVHSDVVGVKLFGGMSRTFAQKSFAVAARTALGSEGKIDYRIFPNRSQDKFKHLVLRNAGSDCEKAHCRDVLINSLVEGIDIEKQSFRPCLLFLNGQYWGIYYIRDKVNKHFIEYSAQIDDDSLDLLEHQNRLKAGSIRPYNALLNFLAEADLTNDALAAELERRMDVANFLTLQAIQIYIDNQDAGGNIKFWRPQTPDGRFRWVLYDTDWGFGLQEELAFQSNTLALHTAPNGPAWPNPPWSTFILRRLLTRPAYRERFIAQLNDMAHTAFAPDRVADYTNDFKDLLTPEYDRHAKRWNYSKLIWQTHLGRIKTFARERPAFMRRFIQAQFEVGDAVRVTITPTGGGAIELNGHYPLKKAITGMFFTKVPLRLKALPYPGFVFAHWQVGEEKYTDRNWEALPDANIGEIRAIFKRADHQLKNQVRITEIAPNNDATGDWVELYNDSPSPIALVGWEIRDRKHTFTFPEVRLPAQSYLIVCQDSTAFRRVYPRATHIVGNFPFGLSKRSETVYLYADNGALIDSVSYHDLSQDSTFVWALADNQWEERIGFGTPGDDNAHQSRNDSLRYLYLALALGALVLASVVGWRLRYGTSQWAR